MPSVKERTLLILLLSWSAFGLAQTFFQSEINGRVYSDEGDVAGTHVLNTTTQRATITDEIGFFDIPAHINDTLVFSAVQFKRKVLVVSAEMLSSPMLLIPLEPSLTELDEVVVRPYNLSGNMAKDVQTLDVEPVVSASSLGLPNAGVVKISQAERQLHEATTGGGIVPLNPILNAISGRTKMLKKRVARDEVYARTQRIRGYYPDSLFISDLHVPKEKIPDFMYFCEVDTAFQKLAKTGDKLKIWDYMKARSKGYKENNPELKE